MMTATQQTISVAKQYSRHPAGRVDADGPFNGKKFLERLLLPTFQRCREAGRTLRVELDGVAGYGSSFLEEAFGGLVREAGLPANQILGTLQLVTEDDGLREEVLEYMQDATAGR